jgi:tRNA (mo5U34)-methyltransferase
MNELDSIRWWHRIDLGDCITPGANHDSDETLEKLNLPEDMSGLSVLDLGAWDGYYSFACEKRNAKRVVACDKIIWEEQNIWSQDKGFDYAHKHLNSKVEKVVSSIEELPEKNLGKFDIVLMLGILYHAKNPIEYLEKVKTVCKDVIYVETVIDMLDVEVPAARYYVGKELNNDGSNHWGLNPLAVHGVMSDIGFKNIVNIPLSNPSRMIFRANV